MYKFSGREKYSRTDSHAEPCSTKQNLTTFIDTAHEVALVFENINNVPAVDRNVQIYSRIYLSLN